MCLGIPGQITEITDIHNQLAVVDISGVKRQVNIACIVDDLHPVEACVGDWVLVHVGFALNRLELIPNHQHKLLQDGDRQQYKQY